MGIAIQAISSHPLLTRAVEETLARTKDLEVLPSAADEAEAASRVGVPRLFLLDACSLRTDLGPLAQRCRATSPGSKFIALLAPEAANFAQELRLFYWGIDGFVKLDRTWQTELPEAVRSVLGGQIWVPSQVLSAFAQQAKALQDVQFLAGQSLTAREGQVLQLLMRHLPNKDISKVLAISERTAKFHVSNILAKLGFEGRNELLPENFAMSASTSARSADSLHGRARRIGLSSESELSRSAECDREHQQHEISIHRPERRDRKGAADRDGRSVGSSGPGGVPGRGD